MAGLEDLLEPIDLAPVMRRWAGATKSRLVAALLEGREAGTGRALAGDSATTQRIKGHGQVGIHHERLINAVRTGFLEIDRDGSSASVHAFAATGKEIVAFRSFLAGAPTNVLKRKYRGKRLAPGSPVRQVFNRQVGRTATGETYSRTLAPVPARDFVGVDERDVDAAGEDLLDAALRGWGFA